MIKRGRQKRSLHFLAVIFGVLQLLHGACSFAGTIKTPSSVARALPQPSVFSSADINTGRIDDARASARHASVDDVAEDAKAVSTGINEPLSVTRPSSTAIAQALAKTLQSEETQASARAWVDMMFGLEDGIADATQLATNEVLVAFYALFESIRTTPAVKLGLRGTPFVLKKNDIDNSQLASLDGFFSWEDLQKSVQDPYTFLEAGRGTTDNRKGWKMAMVANGGQTYDDTRLTWDQVQLALTQGTVVLNSAGAHIAKLAGPCLACLDATCLPNALNCYVTAPGMRTSAPPHTDKQDVIVVQTSGRKHWRIYSPPDPTRNPNADMFARGKGDDNLPLYALEDGFGCELLLDTILEEGDVLFIPAAFPHTTDTVNGSNGEKDDKKGDAVSIHLTFGLDTRIWDLDYLGLRRWALRRAQVKDTKLGQLDLMDNKNLGPVNLLPTETLRDLHEALPIGFLDLETNAEGAAKLARKVADEAMCISRDVDSEITSRMGSNVMIETTLRLQQYGYQVLNIHRDMYLAAIQEGRTRDLERAMTAHLDDGSTTTPVSTNNLELERLSIVRVRSFFDKFESIGNELIEWAFSGTAASSGECNESSLPENWAFTLPLSVGDQVEADLGGAWFAATVKAVRGNLYDVVFFDGDTDTGLERGMLKLLKPPALDTEVDEVDTSGMTAKQLKRWKKEQAKKNTK